MTSRLHLTQDGGDAEIAVVILGRENHSLTLYASDFTRCEVGNEKYVTANKFLWLIEFSNTTEDCSLLSAAIVDSEFEQFVGLFHFLTIQHPTHTDVHFLEELEINSGLDFLCLVIGCLIGFLGIIEFLELECDDLIFDFLEQQCRLSQLMTRFQDVGLSQLLPFKLVDVEHITQFFAAKRQEGFKGNSEVGHQL